jgi:hypothetical protein
MKSADNPYQPTVAELVQPDASGVPLMLKLAIGFYAASFLMRFGRAMLLDMGVRGFGPLAWLGIALIVLLIGMSLARGRRWARMWIVFFTILPIVSLTELRHAPALPVDVLQMMADLSRITAAAMLFLPSVRPWFARARASRPWQSSPTQPG